MMIENYKQSLFPFECQQKLAAEHRSAAEAAAEM